MEAEYPIWIGDAIVQALRVEGWLRSEATPDGLSDTLSAMLHYVQAHPGTTTPDVAAVFGGTYQQVGSQLQQLAKRGLIRSKRTTNGRRYDRVRRWEAVS